MLTNLSSYSFAFSFQEWLYKGKWSEFAQSCLTLCDPVDSSLPGSSVHGIFQAVVLEWIAMSFSRGSSQPRDQTWVSQIVDRRFTVWATLVVSNSLWHDGLSGSSVHGILQARILGWVVWLVRSGKVSLRKWQLTWAPQRNWSLPQIEDWKPEETRTCAWWAGLYPLYPSPEASFWISVIVGWERMMKWNQT